MSATWAFSPDRPTKRPVGAAPGFRDVYSDRGYGRLREVGYAGYIWSSSVPSGSSTAHYLTFHYGGIDPQYSYYRAYGRQLRCLQEEGFRCPAGRHPACFRGHSVKPSGPYPLGKNQSLSSPPLEPRGLLLSVMRQKVGKDRSQGVFAPLANPHRFLACHRRKVRPVAHHLEALQNPGWSAQRHRRGRRFYESRQVQSQAPPSHLFPHSRLEETGGPDASPSGGPQLSLRSMRSLPGARPEKTVSVRAPWRFILFRQERNS